VKIYFKKIYYGDVRVYFGFKLIAKKKISLN
jgi:hypothetical protein